MAGWFKQHRFVTLAVSAWLLACLPVQAFPCFITAIQSQTLTSEVNEARMVLFGVLANAKQGPQPGAPDGTTDLIIEKVFKDHPILKNPKLITLPRYIDLGPNGGKHRFLVFIDVFKGKIDPYRGIVVTADCDMADYLKGAIELKDQRKEKRLRFFFDYLDNTDPEISNDAYKEFANADYKDYRDMAITLPADRIAGWLKDGTTPSYRFGLYAALLGHCGQEEHASLLRKMLEDPEKQSAGGMDGMLARYSGKPTCSPPPLYSSGMDGMLAGYVMLKPREGWDYLKGIIRDPQKKFLRRYAALKAARFFWDFRQNLISKQDLIEGLLPLLEMQDIADLVIEDFRKRGCWELTDRILELQNSPVYNVNVVKRSILRFALTAKDNNAAKQFVAAQRKKDPQMVADVEELLKLDQPPAQAAPGASKSTPSRN